MEIEGVRQQLEELWAYFEDFDRSTDDVVFQTFNYVKNAHLVCQFLLLEGRFAELQRCLHLCRSAFVDVVFPGLMNTCSEQESKRFARVEVEPPHPKRPAGDEKRSITGLSHRSCALLLPSVDPMPNRPRTPQRESVYPDPNPVDVGGCPVHHLSSEDLRLLNALQDRTTQLERLCSCARDLSPGRDTSYYIRKLNLQFSATAGAEDREVLQPPERGVSIGQPNQLNRYKLLSAFPPLVTKASSVLDRAANHHSPPPTELEETNVQAENVKKLYRALQEKCNVIDEGWDEDVEEKDRQPLYLKEVDSSLLRSFESHEDEQEEEELSFRREKKTDGFLVRPPLFVPSRQIRLPEMKKHIMGYKRRSLTESYSDRHVHRSPSTGLTPYFLTSDQHGPLTTSPHNRSENNNLLPLLNGSSTGSPTTTQGADVASVHPLSASESDYCSGYGGSEVQDAEGAEAAARCRRAVRNAMQCMNSVEDNLAVAVDHATSLLSYHFAQCRQKPHSLQKGVKLLPLLLSSVAINQEDTRKDNVGGTAGEREEQEESLSSRATDQFSATTTQPSSVRQGDRRESSSGLVPPLFAHSPFSQPIASASASMTGEPPRRSDEMNLVLPRGPARHMHMNSEEPPSASFDGDASHISNGLTLRFPGREEVAIESQPECFLMAQNPSLSETSQFSTTWNHSRNEAPRTCLQALLSHSAGHTKPRTPSGASPLPSSGGRPSITTDRRDSAAVEKDNPSPLSSDIQVKLVTSAVEHFNEDVRDLVLRHSSQTAIGSGGRPRLSSPPSPTSAVIERRHLSSRLENGSPGQEAGSRPAVAASLSQVSAERHSPMQSQLCDSLECEIPYLLANVPQTLPIPLSGSASPYQDDSSPYSSFVGCRSITGVFQSPLASMKLTRGEGDNLSPRHFNTQQHHLQLQAPGSPRLLTCATLRISLSAHRIQQAWRKYRARRELVRRQLLTELELEESSMQDYAAVLIQTALRRYQSMLSLQRLRNQLTYSTESPSGRWSVESVVSVGQMMSPRKADGFSLAPALYSVPPSLKGGQKAALRHLQRRIAAGRIARFFRRYCVSVGLGKEFKAMLYFVTGKCSADQMAKDLALRSFSAALLLPSPPSPSSLVSPPHAPSSTNKKLVNPIMRK